MYQEVCIPSASVYIKSFYYIDCIVFFLRLGEAVSMIGLGSQDGEFRWVEGCKGAEGLWVFICRCR